MQECKKAKENAKDKKNNNYKIIVTYDENGKSFQSIAESILIRKLQEF